MVRGTITSKQVLGESILCLFFTNNVLAILVRDLELEVESFF